MCVRNFSIFYILMYGLYPTFNFQVKGTAVKLVLVGDLTPVVASVVLFGLDDVHLKSVNLSESCSYWK